MICPKCKNQISNNLLRCPVCNLKVKLVCPNCKSLNRLGVQKCEHCEFELIKFCENCKCANLPTASVCRKCGIEFPTKNIDQAENVEKMEEVEDKIEQFEPPQGFKDQLEAKNSIIEAIKSPHKFIIALSAPEGYGKSLILRYMLSDFQYKNSGYVWLWGECSALTQVSTFGLIQDMFLNYLGLSGFCVDVQNFSKKNKSLFQNIFSKMNAAEISDFINFLYPHETAKFEDILFNKEKTFEMLEKALWSISQNKKMNIVIDDFDLVDGASYEFLSSIVSKGFLNEDLKIIFTQKDKKIAQGYFYSESLTDGFYENIFLGKIDKEQMNNLIKTILNGANPLPEGLKSKIYKNAKGSSAYVEQVMLLLGELGIVYKENDETKFSEDEWTFELPDDVFGVLKLRLEKIKEDFSHVLKILYAASVLGNKFNIQILESIAQMEQESFKNTLNFLKNVGFIEQVNPNSLVFKNTQIWRYVFEEAKISSEFNEINEKLYNILNPLVLSNSSLKALIVQNIEQKSLAYNIWSNNTRLASYIGDSTLYVIFEKQCLKLVKELKLQNAQVIENNICERIGKLLHVSNPEEAIEYLSSAILYYKKFQNKIKLIELSGYIAKSCQKVGNYFGIIETADLVIEQLNPKEHGLEIAFVKSRKLEALLHIGNCEQIINLVNNEIIGILEAHLAKPNKNKLIPATDIYKAWLDTTLKLATAYIIQGNNRSFELLESILEAIRINKIEDVQYLCKVQISQALAHTFRGDIQASDDILDEIVQQYKTRKLDDDIVSRWNLIYILNKVFKKDTTRLKEDLFSVATFANNCNDLFTKNILKTILGVIIRNEGNLSKALEIYNEQIIFFSKEKIATGALLCWLLIAEATLNSQSADKALDIAQKALEVAKNPKINNYYFMTCYKKLIAEIYIIKGDFEAAKMYLEKALLIANKFDLKFLQMLLYELYGKYLEEIVTKQADNKLHLADSALKMYKKSIDIAAQLKLKAHVAAIERNQSGFKAYCQLNNIHLI